MAQVYSQNINIKTSPWAAIGQMGLGAVFGGGYDMSSMMGMGGSIFGMTGYGTGSYSFGSLTGYGYGSNCFGIGTPAYAGITGAEVGYTCCSAFLGVALSGIGELISNKKSKESTEDKIESFENNAEKYLDTLNKDGGTYTLNSDFSGDTIKNSLLSKYDTSIKAANDEIKTRIESIDSNIKNINDTKPQQNQYTKTEDNKTVNDTDAYEKALSEWEKENKSKIEKLEKEKTELEDGDKNNELVKALNKAKEAKEARENEINSAIKELRKIQKEYNELTLNKGLNKADGTAFSRLRNSDASKEKSAIHKFRKAQERYMKDKSNPDEVKAAFNAWPEDTQYTQLKESARKWCEANKISLK